MITQENCIIAYAKKVYGVQIFYRNHVMYVKTEDDIYRVDFHLSNDSIYRFCSINKPLVLTETNLARGLFRVGAHATYKVANKIPTNADWEKFVNDAFAFMARKEC